MSGKPEPSRNVVDAPEKTYRGLRSFNAGMGFLHLVQAILMIVLSLLAKTALTWMNFAGTLAPV